MAELRRGYKESRDGGWKARPAKSVRLAEHHYAEERIDEASGAAGDYGKRYVERIGACLEAFFEMPAVAAARDAEPGDWLACEEMSTFELFDTKIFAIPDFAFLDRSGEGEPAVRIVDWKTGRPSDADRFQLEVYAFYARERWGVDPPRTKPVDVYLESGETAEVAIDEASLEETLARIETSLSEMKAVHFDADRSKGDPEDFPMVPKRGTRECADVQLPGDLRAGLRRSRRGAERREPAHARRPGRLSAAHVRALRLRPRPDPERRGRPASSPRCPRWPGLRG